MNTRQVYAFWLGKRILTQEVACSEHEARLKARENVTLWCDRPDEAPFEAIVRLNRSTVKIYPLN